MARITYVEPQQATPEVKQIYEQALKNQVGNVHKALAHRPDILKTFLSFYASVGRHMERRLYELVYIRVSMINGCYYCTQHHLASSKRAGVTPEDWKALQSPARAHFTEKEKTALGFAEKLTRDPHSISDADISALKPHFNDGEILELDVLIGVINLTNRLTDPLGLELEMPEQKIPAA